MRYHDNAGAKVPQVFSYEDAVEVLERAPKRTGRIGHNTVVGKYEDGSIFFMLYNTPIVVYHPDGRIVLNSGGHRTVTTKARMNSLLPPTIRVFQERREWGVNTRRAGAESWEHVVAYRDGMTLQRNDRGSWIVMDYGEGASHRRSYLDTEGREHPLRLNPRKGRRELSVPEKHQLRVAERTLRMPEAMRGVMGGPSRKEAEEIVERLTGKPHRLHGNPPKKGYADFGSISEGTLDPEDLAGAFGSALEDLYRQSGEKMPPHVKKLITESEEADADDLPDINEELMQELEHFAPPYGYFGTHPGDAADFGFWLSSDSLTDAIHDGDLLQVDDLSEVPEDYEGEVLHVNDHGNTSLYAADGKGNFKEIWAVV